MKYTPKTNSKWIDLALNQSFLLERFWLSNCWPFFCISHVWWFPNIALPPVLIHLMFGFSMNFLPSSELGVPPWLWKPPYVYGCFSWILSREITVPCWAWAPSRSGHLVNHLWRGSPWSLGLKRWDSTRKNGDFFFGEFIEKNMADIEWWLNGDWMVYTSSSGYHLQPLMVYWRFYVGAIALGDLVMLPVMVKSSNRIIGINMAMAWLGTSLWQWFSWLSSSNT